MSAAAFAKGLLDLEGQLTPILVSLVSKDSSMLDGLENASIEMEEAKSGAGNNWAKGHHTEGGLTEADVDGFVEEVLVNGKPWSSGVQEVLTGSHVFVCAHASRDQRCGVCGPVLIEKFKEEIASRELTGQVFVSGCSHVGGHKYAGNLIIFSADAEGKVGGHWYGYATPDDVGAFLDQHIAKGEIIERLWRGQMGGPIEEAGKVEEKKLPNGKHAEVVEKPNGDTNEVKTETAGSCCQGVNGVSCCRDPSPEVKETSEEKEKKGASKFSCLMRKWDQSEVYTAVAIVGAVATVAVAYSFYKRSG